MKRITSRIKTGLKRLGLREISPSILEKTKLAVKEVSEDSSSRTTTQYLLINGKPAIRHTFEIISIIDSYYFSATTYLYDENGKLVEKVDVERGEMIRGNKIKIRQYDPPGSWKGRLVDSGSRNFDYVVNSS